MKKIAQPVEKGDDISFYNVKTKRTVKCTVDRLTKHKLRNGRQAVIARGETSQGDAVCRIVENRAMRKSRKAATRKTARKTKTVRKRKTAKKTGRKTKSKKAAKTRYVLAK